MELGTQLVRVEKHGDVSVATLDSSPVNALSTGLRGALLAAVAEANKDVGTKALVLVGAGRGFSGGADIKEFGKPPQSPSLHDLIDAVEGSAKPVVAAMHGMTLGGGLELALACHARVAVRDAKMGLPEVKLGLLPGAGGTQRLPRLLGPEKALEMITSGAPIGAKAALAEGLLDEIVEGDLPKARSPSRASSSPDPSPRRSATATTRSHRCAGSPRSSTRSARPTPASSAATRRRRSASRRCRLPSRCRSTRASSTSASSSPS